MRGHARRLLLLLLLLLVRPLRPLMPLHLHLLLPHLLSHTILLKYLPLHLNNVISSQPPLHLSLFGTSPLPVQIVSRPLLSYLYVETQSPSTQIECQRSSRRGRSHR